MLGGPGFLNHGFSPGRGPFGRVLCAGLALFLLVPAGARAHRLVVDCQVYRGPRVLVTCLYSDPVKAYPAEGARVRVFRSGRQIREGKTDAKGQVLFALDGAAALRVEAYQEGHREEVDIPAADLEKALPAPSDLPPPPSSPPPGTQGPETSGGSPPNKTDVSPKKENEPVPEVSKETPVASVASADSGDASLREYVRDGIAGLGFLFGLAAFVLSLRNARRLRELNQGNRSV